jgi:hypothetical protein
VPRAEASARLMQPIRASHAPTRRDRGGRSARVRAGYALLEALALVPRAIPAARKAAA